MLAEINAFSAGCITLAVRRGMSPSFVESALFYRIGVAAKRGRCTVVLQLADVPECRPITLDGLLSFAGRTLTPLGFRVLPERVEGELTGVRLSW